MKTVNAQTITETIAHLCIDANRNLPKDVAAALHQAEELYCEAEENEPEVQTT